MGEAAPPIITLTTDFGLDDPYVAAMKCVILSINPAARMVDISHGIRPQQVEQGAFILESVRPYFAAGAIHLAVVDPGVGTGRLPIVLQTEQGLFVGPDNGLLSAGLPDEARMQVMGNPGPLPLPGGCAAFVLADERFHWQPVSRTFHGRDIFAPVAAHLSLGVPLQEFGPRLSEVLAFPPFRADRQADGSLLGRVAHIDRFGNLITTVLRQQLGVGTVTVEVCGRRIEGLVQTFAEGSGLMALVGSTGRLEIAVREGSAAAELGANIGDPVRVLPG